VGVDEYKHESLLSDGHCQYLFQVIFDQDRKVEAARFDKRALLGYLGLLYGSEHSAYLEGVK
jgi:hypothetical protein